MKQLQRAFNTRIMKHINTTKSTMGLARDRLSFIGGDRLQERTTGVGKAKPWKSSLIQCQAQILNRDRGFEPRSCTDTFCHETSVVLYDARANQHSSWLAKCASDVITRTNKTEWWKIWGFFKRAKVPKTEFSYSSYLCQKTVRLSDSRGDPTICILFLDFVRFPSLLAFFEFPWASVSKRVSVQTDSYENVFRLRAHFPNQTRLLLFFYYFILHSTHLHQKHLKLKLRLQTLLI